MSESLYRSYRILPCQVGGLNYCFDLDRIHSVRGSERLQINPGGESPAGWLLGDDEISVFDLAERLNLQLRSVGGRVVVLNSATGPFGLLVDRVQRGLEVEEKEIHRLPSVAGAGAQKLIEGVLIRDGRPLLMLEPAGLEESAATAPDGDDNTSKALLPELNVEPGSAPTGSGQVVLFDTRFTASFDKKVTYGLSIRQVIELVDMPAVTPLPATPPFVRGVVAWRGRPLIVVDLDRRFGWTDRLESIEERMLVVWAASGQPIGLPTRSTVRLQSLPIDHSVVKVGRQAGDPSLGLFQLQDSTLVIPDLSGFAVDPGGKSASVEQETRSGES